MTVEEAFQIIKENCTDIYENMELDESNADYYLSEPIYEAKIEKVEFFYGATKGVFAFEDCDYVIKIPFNGYLGDSADDGYYDEELDDWIYDDEQVHYDFQCACDEAYGWDYCKAEMLRYQKAVQLGLQKSFLETFQIGNINGYPIYAQKKMEVTSCTREDLLRHNSKHKRVEKYIKRIGGALEKLIKDENPVNYSWGVETLRHFGEKYTRKLFNFIDEENINDLHSSNVGYIKGYPVLMDYAGYDDN